MENNSPFTLSPMQLFKAVGAKLTKALKVTAESAVAFFKDVVASFALEGTQQLVPATVNSNAPIRERAAMALAADPRSFHL